MQSGSITTEQASIGVADGQDCQSVPSRWPWAFVIVGAILSVLCVALVLAVHANSPRTLASMHGFLHAAIVQRLQAFSLPPENPFFAGESICYYWFFHLLGAIVSRVALVDPLHALEWVIGSSLIVLVFASLAIGRRLYQSLVAGVCIGFLALVGANPFGPFIWIAHGIFDNGAAFRDNLTDTFGPYIYQSQIGARLYGPNLPYFFNITSRPVALALILPIGLALCGAMRRRTIRSGVGVALAVMLCTAISPVIGLAVGGVLCASLGTMWIMSLRPKRLGIDESDVPSSGAWWTGIIGIVAGMVLAVPTFSQMLSNSQGGMEFMLTSYKGVKHIVAVVVGAGPIAVFAWYGHKRLCGIDAAFLKVLMLAAAFLLLASVAVYLPVENSCNLFHSAIVLLAIPASGKLCRREMKSASSSHRTWKYFLVPGCFAPTAILIVLAYSGRAPAQLMTEGVHLRRLPVDSEISQLYRWIEKSTEPDAMIVTDPRERVAVQGNVPELPAMTNRVLFVGAAGYMTDPYPDAERRRAIAIKLVGGQALVSSEEAYLSALRDVVYVVKYQVEEKETVQLQLLYGPALFAEGVCSVYRWQPS